MNHGVHAVQHEVEHTIQHDNQVGQNDKKLNRQVALLISVLALFLALSETLGKGAQTAALNSQIESSNLWSFFQAKSLRRTSILIASERSKLDLTAVADPAHRTAIQRQIEDWANTAAGYRSDPDAAGGKGEGMVELSRRAIEEDNHRDEYLAKYHHYEFASAALQIGIVLASATVITGVVALTVLAGGLGLLGLVLMALGLFAPNLFHFP